MEAFDARTFLEGLFRPAPPDPWKVDLDPDDLPGDWRVHASRGIALAGVGRRVEARQEAEWIGNSTIYRRSFYFGIGLKQAQARIFAQAGMAGEAVGKIEFLLSVGFETVHSLQFDPRWDPIRSDPRFQSLLKSYGQ